MGLNIPSYGASKKYTADTAIGLGAVIGAPCTIQSITQDASNNNIVTFKWTATDGTTKTQQMTVPPGVSITGFTTIDDTHIVWNLSDGTQTAQMTIPEQNIAISADSGNALVKKADGLYVSTTGSAVSADTGNQIVNKVDGLYAGHDADKVDVDQTVANAGKALIVGADGMVTVGDAGAKLSEKTGNDIEELKTEVTATDNGLFLHVPVKEVKLAGSTLTPDTTGSVDISLSTDTDNIITTDATGLLAKTKVSNKSNNVISLVTGSADPLEDGIYAQATDAKISTKADNVLTNITGSALQSENGLYVDGANLHGHEEYTDTEIDSLFTGTAQQIQAYSDLIKDSDISTASLWSSDKINTEISTVDTKIDTLVGDLTTLDTTDKSDVVGAINELKNSVSDGKTAVAGAITAKGVATASTDSFATMATNIGSIQTGGTYQTKTVTPSTTTQTVTPDTGYDALSSVSVGAIATETKSATLSTTAQTITPASGKYLTSVSVPAVTGNAELTHVLSGKTFNSATAGIAKTGTMTNNSGKDLDATLTSDDTYTYLAPNVDGYVTTDTKLRTLNTNLVQDLIIPRIELLFNGPTVSTGSGIIAGSFYLDVTNYSKVKIGSSSFTFNLYGETKSNLIVSNGKTNTVYDISSINTLEISISKSSITVNEKYILTKIQLFN